MNWIDRESPEGCSDHSRGNFAQVCFNGTSAEVSWCQLVSVRDRFCSFLVTPALASFISCFGIFCVLCDSFSMLLTHFFHAL